MSILMPDPSNAHSGAHIIIGAGGHARVVAEALALAGGTLAGHVSPTGAKDLGPYLGDDFALPGLLENTTHRVLMGLGFVDRVSMLRRKALLDTIPQARWDTLFHPTAVISPSVHLGSGCFVAASATIGTNTEIGPAALINTNATIDHDCAIGKNVHVATGVTIAGGVQVGEDCLIGAGATVRQGIVIGSGVIIGAGALVIRDVPDNTTAVGVPAR